MILTLFTEYFSNENIFCFSKLTLWKFRQIVHTHFCLKFRETDVFTRIDFTKYFYYFDIRLYVKHCMHVMTYISTCTYLHIHRYFALAVIRTLIQLTISYVNKSFFTKILYLTKNRMYVIFT